MSNIIAIEMRRADIGVSRARLCRAARLNRSTYGRLMAKPGSGRAASFTQLAAALEALAQIDQSTQQTTTRKGASHVRP